MGILVGDGPTLLLSSPATHGRHIEKGEEGTRDLRSEKDGGSGEPPSCFLHSSAELRNHSTLTPLLLKFPLTRTVPTSFLSQNPVGRHSSVFIESFFLELDFTTETQENPMREIHFFLNGLETILIKERTR